MFKWYKRYLERRTEEKSHQADRQLDALRFRYHAFKNLLITNNDLLELMTRMEMQLQDCPKIIPGLKASADKLLKLTLDLVQNLNYLTEGSFTYLFHMLEPISSELASIARELDPGDNVPLICPVSETHIDLITVVGGKAAPLGMLKEALKLPVPEGFVITTKACQLFLERNNLIRPIRDLLRRLTPEDFHEVDHASESIRNMIMGARIPQELRDAMESAYEALASRMQPHSVAGLAVRSSAIPEGGSHTFAGQYETVLNVISKEGFFEAYKEVVASNFNENSLNYRLHRQMGFQETDMAVVCLAMVQARSAGSLYTVDPNDIQSERMIVCSIWGLGEYLVEGRLPSDIFHVSRMDPSRFEVVHLAKKNLKLVCDMENGGTREEEVAEKDSLRFSLTEQEIELLCERGLAIEKYMGFPQDIEWAIAEDGTAYIIQSRTLYTGDGARESAHKVLEGMKLLMERGITASKGLSSGPIAVVKQAEEIENVQAGSIVVAPEAPAKIVKICNKLHGIILERGNPLEHLACVAREYRIPMLVRATGATQILRDGQVITLDADEAKVYEGQAQLRELAPAEPAVGRKRDHVQSSPELEKLRRLIFPLDLLEVRDPILQMQSCKSIHDVIRFCHEQGIEGMFEVNDGEYEKNRFYTSRLDVPIPFQMDIINLGGGFSVAGHPRNVQLDQITSVPLLALWKGISHEGIRWSGTPVKPNMRSLSSVMSNTMLDAARAGRALGSRTYVLISRDYMNLNSRLAYHFAMVDTLCSHDAAANYINFRFKGGGTGVDRRILRVRFIARILDSLGFFMNIKEDLINATIKGLPMQEQEGTLDMIGRLLGCSRLLDMAMNDESTMEWFVEAFEQGNYSFEPDSRFEELQG